MQRSATQLTRVVPGFKILHFAGVSGGDPLRKMPKLREISDRRDAREIKTGIAGGLPDEFGSEIQPFPIIACIGSARGVARPESVSTVEFKNLDKGDLNSYIVI